MSLWDWVVDNVDTGVKIWNIYDDYETNKDMRNDIRSSNPYGAVNAQAAADLHAIYADSGQAYLATDVGQNSLDAYRQGYDRNQTPGNRLGTGAANRRGMNELTIRQQIVNDRIAQLQGTPKHNEQAGPNMAEIRDQGNFNTAYGIADVIRGAQGSDLGNIFNNRNGVTPGNFRNRSTGGINDGWFE